MAFLPRVLAAALLAIVLGGAPWSAVASDKQWTEYGRLPGDAPVFGLANDPTQPTTVYAATMGAGLLRTDDGQTWREVSKALPRRVWKLAVDAARDEQGFAPLYLGTTGGFYKSLDGGHTWSQLGKGLATAGALNVRSVAMGRGNLVIGTSDGVYKSADGGQSWQAMGLSGMDISSVAFAQYSQPTVVLAGIDGTKNPGSRLLISQDLSSSWSPVKGLPSDMVVSAIAAGPVPGGAVFRPLFVAGSSGVYKSDDRAQTWGQLSGLPAQGFGSLAPSPADPNILYAGSDGSAGSGGGVWRTTDRGSTWAQVAAGMNAHGVTAVTVGRDSPATLVAATWDADTPAVVLYELTDAQNPPSGQPESGVCPEPITCPGGAPPAPPALTGALVSSRPVEAVACPSPTPTPARKPSPTPKASAQPGTSSPRPSPLPSPTVLVNCGVATPRGPTPPGSDLPLGIAVAALGLLFLALVLRILFVRR